MTKTPTPFLNIFWGSLYEVKIDCNECNWMMLRGIFIVWLDEIVLQNLKRLKHWLNFIKIVDQIQLHMPAMSSNLRPDGPEDWGSSHYFQTYPPSSFKCKCKYWQTVYKTTCACALSLLESCAFWLCKMFVY